MQRQPRTHASLLPFQSTARTQANLRPTKTVPPSQLSLLRALLPRKPRGRICAPAIILRAMPRAPLCAIGAESDVQCIALTRDARWLYTGTRDGHITK